MRGLVRNGGLFTLAFVGMFAAMALGSEPVASQTGLYQRVMFMHVQDYLSQIDPTLSDDGHPAVGKFVSSSLITGSPLFNVRPFPTNLDPEFIIGTPQGGTTFVRLGTNGTILDSTNLAIFSEITGTYLFTNKVAPMLSGFDTIPTNWYLKDHLVVSGLLNPLHPSTQGNSTGVMLIDPMTGQAHAIGSTYRFVADDNSIVYEDVAAAVASIDGNFNTTDNNLTWYAMIYSKNDLNAGGVEFMALDEPRLWNGDLPGSGGWGVEGDAPGPPFPNAHPKVTNNAWHEAYSFPGMINNLLQYIVPYFVRLNPPGVQIMNCGAPPNTPVFITGHVILASAPPPMYGPRVDFFQAGGTFIGGPVTTILPVPAGPFASWPTPNCFYGMYPVGDWLFIVAGPSSGGTEGTGIHYEMVLMPEGADGAGDGDSGYRGPPWTGDSTSGVGAAGGFSDPAGRVQYTYTSPGPNSSSARCITRSPYLTPLTNWGPHLGGAGSTVPIDFHTDAEQALGSNFRLGPQMQAGFHSSYDPANSFPGSKGGNGQGSNARGACSKSATGNEGAALGLLSLLAVAFLLVKTVRA